MNDKALLIVIDGSGCGQGALPANRRRNMGRTGSAGQAGDFGDRRASRTLVA